MTDDLKTCFQIMSDKALPITRKINYYAGAHPLAFVNKHYAEVVNNSVVFTKNFCQVVVNTTRDRLQIASWDTGDDEALHEMAEDVWKYTLKKTMTPVHVSALTTGEAFIIAWPDANKVMKAYYHDPRQVACIYDGEDPDKMICAAKQWCNGGKYYLNLYYPDRIEHYVASSAPHSATAFQPTDNPVENNPFKQIPVFHFLLEAQNCIGELTAGVLSLQDAMNKVLNDMMVASEFSSFPQRYAIGNLKEGSITVGPGQLATVPGAAQGDQPTELGSFPTTDPQNYLLPIDNLADSMAVLSATPKHFFTGAAGAPSGEALTAMESPLIAKVQGYQDVLGRTWEQVMGFCLGGAEVEVLWNDPHTQQPYSLALTRKTNVEAGIPIKNLLRDEAWTEEQLDQLEDDQQAQTMATTPQPSPVLMQRANIAPKPMRPEEAEPRFDNVVETPDMAGELARTGAIRRATGRIAQRRTEGY